MVCYAWYLADYLTSLPAASLLQTLHACVVGARALVIIVLRVCSASGGELQCPGIAGFEEESVPCLYESEGCAVEIQDMPLFVQCTLQQAHCNRHTATDTKRHAAESELGSAASQLHCSSKARGHGCLAPEALQLPACTLLDQCSLFSVPAVQAMCTCGCRSERSSGSAAHG